MLALGLGWPSDVTWASLDLVHLLDKEHPTCEDTSVVNHRAEIDGRTQELLRVLLESNAPVSGRRVAEVLGISPTTASNRLKALLDRGLVHAQTAGAAVLWSANEASAEVRALRRNLESSALPTGGQASAPADSAAWTRPLASTKPTRKVVVLTALALEYATVRSYLTEVVPRRTRSGTRYEIGLVRGEHLDWEVYLAEVDMGNSGAAAEVAGAIETFSPQLILFVGVAGGLKPNDQRHGDVVVASMVYNVHSAKIAPDPAGGSQVLSRTFGVPASHRLTQLVRAVSRMAWMVHPVTGKQLQGSTSASPVVHLRAIVAGEVVLADPDSDLRKLIAERFNDAAAIDMESYGVYETAHRYEVPVLAVRGLSDLIGDKNSASDQELQPRAAANAASFAIALLSHADEDDFPLGIPASDPSDGGDPSRSAASRETQVEGADLLTANESLALLAPSLRPWWRRLRDHQGAVADIVIAELAQRSASPVGWLGRLRHRLPHWLREDAQGDTWALVAQFAESHGSQHATWLYNEAAQRADESGEDIIGALHFLKATLMTLRYLSAPESVLDDNATKADLKSAQAEALDRLSDQPLLSLGPVAAFFGGVVSDDPDAILAAAAAALGALGLSSQRLTRTSRLTAGAASTDEDIAPAAAAFTELAETDPDVVDQLRSELLLQVGYALLARSQADSALVVFAEARKFAPATGAPLLGMALSRLQRVDPSGGIADTTLKVSAELAEAEELALLARDRRRVWNVDSGDAVALAIKARAINDPHGALRLALPAPRGVATDAEGKSPKVREAGALAGLYAGEHLLALELAAGISNSVERDLIRAMVMAQMADMDDEVEQALRRALQAIPADRPDQLVRALMGLARLGAPILPDHPGTIAPELARLRDADVEAADLVEAAAALRTGQPQQALIIARQYPTWTPAVEIAAEAAVTAGDPREAFRILQRAGQARGDETLRTQAMFLAADAGLNEEAQYVANQLALSADTETRRRALEMQLTLAERTGQWQEVAEVGRRLVDDHTLNLSDVRREQHVVRYRWSTVNAEFNLRQLERARKMLDEPDMLKPETPSEALLLLAVLHATALPAAQEEAPAGDLAIGHALLERALAVASAFPDDEDVMASALTLVVTLPDTEPLSDALLSRARAFHQEFFDRFPDSTRFRKLPIGEDLGELVEYLRTTFAPRAEQLTNVARQVWLGLCPQSLLADVNGRSYAETLIKKVVGCLVAATPDPALAATEQAAAHAAREAGSVVIDTSALIMLDHLGEKIQRVIAHFSRVLFSASCRDDVLEARNSLALRSPATLGWNPQEQKPRLIEFPPDVVDNWAMTGARLAQRLTFTDVIPASKPAWSWDESLLVASRERTALWADDLPLRHVARSLGIPSFGTLDLIADLVESGQLPQMVLSKVTEEFRRDNVVDLPISDRLLELAAADSWRPGGYSALLLARPSLWTPPSDGFALFMKLIRALPASETKPEPVTSWAAAAMTGLAWAIPLPARPRAIAGIVAWTVLTAGGADVFPKLLEAGENVMAAAAPAGDLLDHTVSVLTETLSNIVPTEQVGVLFTRLITNFDQPRRTQAMQSFLSVPH